MDFYRYGQETEAHCAELISELEEYGLENLSEACISLGMDNMNKHIRRNGELMIQYISCTPSQRRRKHRDLEPRDRALFVLGALYLARTGLAVLKTVQQIQDAPPHYRAVSAQATRAAWDMMIGWPTLWPFDDFPDPFSGKSS